MITYTDLDRKKIDFFDVYLAHSPSIFISWNLNEEWDVTYVSENITQFGYQPEQFLSKQLNYSHIIHTEDFQNVVNKIHQNIDDNFSHTYRIVTNNGKLRWVEDRTVINKDSTGNIINCMSIIIDITEKKEMEQEIFENTSIFRSITENSTIGFFICQDRLIYANRAIEEISGYDLKELYGKHIWDFAYEQSDKEKLQNIIARRCHGELFHCDYSDVRFLTKYNEIKSVRIMSDTIRYKGAWAGIGTIIDITDIVETKKQVNLLAKAVEQSNDLIRITDKNGIITFINNATLEKTGFSSHELIGQTPRIFKSGVHDHSFYQDLWQIILSGKTYRGVFQNRKKDGTLYHEAETITPILDQKGNIEYFIVTSKDISDRINLEQKLFQQATTDTLTGLSNRQKFLNKMELELERYKRYGTHFAISMIDIDHFKEVNDKYGHDTGDEILKEISQLLNNHIRKNDLLARWGGEEFILISVEIDEKKLFSLTKKLREVIEEKKFETVNHLTISIGTTILHKCDTMQTVIKRADKALYLSKNNGRNQVQFIR